MAVKDKDVKQIVEAIGGAENVETATLCDTITISIEGRR